MKNSSFLILLLLACLLPGVTNGFVIAGQDTTALHTPDRGSPERKAIMDALREDYKKGTGDEVIFKVNFLKVHNGWAWADVTPLDNKGKAVAEGGASLLHNEEGQWKVMDLSQVEEDPDNPMGPMDPTPRYIKNVQKKYPGVPADIFPKKQKQ